MEHARQMSVTRTVAAYVMAVVLPSVATGAVRYVSTAGLDTNPGTAEAPWRTIQFAVDNAAAGDEIRVAGGTYAESVVCPETAVGLAISGGYDASWNRDFAGQRTVVDPGNTNFDVLTIQSSTVSLSGLTLTGGRRGITLRAPTQFGPDCAVVLSHCAIRINVSHGLDGASSRAIPYAVKIDNCLIADNGGDGVRLYRSNTAGNKYDYDVLANCTIAGNQGNAFVDSSRYCPDTFFTNCIFSGNGGYGVLHKESMQSSLYYSHFKDCCFHGNGLGHFRGRTEDTGADLIEGGVFIADPLFAGKGDYRLRDGSPCIKAGHVLDSARMDLDGKLRGNERVDLGCYESPFPMAPRHAHTYVDQSATDDSADGATAQTPKKTIQAALAVTAEGGTCHIAPGLYHGEVILATPGVTVEGADGGKTVLLGSKGLAAVTLAESGLTVRGLTIMGADRGIYLNGISTTNALVEDCAVRSNVFGIATFHDNSATPHRQFRRFYRLSRCRIEENEKDGVLHYSGGWVAMSAGNTLVQGNGGNGLALLGDWHAERSIHIVNCTIADNGGDGYVDGSGYSPEIYFVNCIVSGNGGYGIRHQGYAPNWPNYCRLKDCCFHGNGLGHFRDRSEEAGVDLIEGGVFIADPLFVGKGDYRLLEGSPCVKVGSVHAQDGYDLDGTSRGPARSDLGCFESSFETSFRYPDTYADLDAPDDSADGSTPATAKKTISAALAVTAEGGTCHVAPGRYDGEVVLSTPGVTLAGAGAAATVIRVPRGCNAVMLAEGNLTIRGLRIEGADHGLFLSGIATTNALVEDCVIRSNVFGLATFNDHTSGNHRHYHRSYRLSRCRIECNERDGVKHASGGWVVLLAENTLIVGNGGDGLGHWGDWHAERSTQVLNCTIADNGGRGIVANNNYTPEIFITNSIVCGNGGTGLERKGTVPKTHFTHVAYSCVHDNGGGTNFYGAMISVGDGMITNAGPAFVAGKYRLSDLSPCINAGIDTELALDLARGPRRRHGGTDIGAYEFARLGTVLLLR